MKRRRFAVIGAVLLLMIAVTLFRFGSPAAVNPTRVLLGLASLLLVIGGVDPAPDAVPWSRFVGLGLRVFGAPTVFYWVEPVASGGRTAGDLRFALVGVATAVAFAFVDVDSLPGGRHFDPSRIEPGPTVGHGNETEVG